MKNNEKESKIKILLEEYKTVNEEIKFYLHESTRCFILGAILIAIYLGWGVGSPDQASGFSRKIHDYGPYAFIVLIIYFLSILYIRLGLSQFRANLEKKINKIANSELLSFESIYLRKFQSRSFLRLSDAWYARIPTPMLFLGFLVIAAFLFVYIFKGISNQKIIFYSLLSACILEVVYVFFIYPRLIERISKKNG